jgi:hypothetical protein
MSAIEHQQPSEQETNIPDIEDFFWALMFIFTEHNQWDSPDAFETANQSLMIELKFRNFLSRQSFRAWENRAIEIGDFVTHQLAKSPNLRRIVEMNQTETVTSYIKQPGLALNRLYEEREYRKSNGGR